MEKTKMEEEKKESNKHQKENKNKNKRKIVKAIMSNICTPKMSCFNNYSKLISNNF